VARSAAESDNVAADRSGVNVQLVAVMVLPLTALLMVITIGSVTLHHQALRTLVSKRDARAADLSAGVLRAEVARRAARVLALASRAADRPPQDGALAASDRDADDFSGGLAYFTPDGALIAETTNRTHWDNDALTGVLARAAAAPAFSNAFGDLGTGTPLVLVAARTDGGPVAVGAFSPAAIAHGALADAFAAADPSQSGLIIVDRAHRVLYRAGTLEIEPDPASHPGIVAALSGQQGTLFVDHGGSDEHVVAYSPVTPMGWAVVIEEAWRAAASPVLQTNLVGPLVLLPALLLALLGLWFGARQVVQPLRVLESRADALAAGNPEAIAAPVGGIAEIRHLQDALIQAAHRVRDARQAMRGYIGAITAGQEEERRRLARELHDDTLQALIALNQRLQLALLDHADDPDAAALHDIQMLTERTIQNVRRAMQALRPVYLEALGLIAALEMLARETEQATDLVVTFRRVGDERRIGAEAELGLYRIAQEAISNTVRHARATAAAVTLTFAPDEVTLAIVDDGRGFTTRSDVPGLPTTGQFGLVHLRERAELLGGRLVIDSGPGRGTRVTVALREVAPRQVAAPVRRA